MLLHTPICILLLHLLRQLLSYSHTSSPVLNRTPRDISWRQPPCQRDWSIPGVFWVAPPCWPGPTQRSCTAWHLWGLHLPSEWDPAGQSTVTLYAQHWLSAWILLQTWAGDGLSNFARWRLFLLMFQQWVMAAHINRHSRVILTSQVGANGQRDSDVWETRAATGSGAARNGRLARSSNQADILSVIFPECLF